ncbi:MAG: amidase [Acidimicrobiales bacterium]
MTAAADTRWLDATAHAELFASGKASSVELVQAAVDRIEALDGPINAVVIRWFDDALAEAADYDRRRAAGEELGPFAGVPFLLKDLYAPMAGKPMTNGNKALAEAMPISPSDSNLVARFRDAGLVIMGRTNSPELGSLSVTEPEAFGPTRNPWGLDHTPGGSSGGAAAAVAAGMVPFANASDGGGSIRIPASCAGLFGLKTSRGRISLGPFRDEAGLSVEFALTRSVRDAARLLDAVHGPGVGDGVIAPPPVRPYVDELGADPGSLRIGILDHHPADLPVHDDCVAAVRDAGALLESLGHRVEPGFPSVLADASFSGRFIAMWGAGMKTGIDALGAMLGRELTQDEVEPVNWAQVEFVKGMSAIDYSTALGAVADYRRQVQSWWADGWDLLLTPTIAEPPPRIGEHANDPDDPLAPLMRAGEYVTFTPPFNTSGQPAMNLPLWWNDAGLPIGVQLVAAYGREDLLLRLASQVEAARPWADRRPSA